MVSSNILCRVLRGITEHNSSHAIICIATVSHIRYSQTLNNQNTIQNTLKYDELIDSRVGKYGRYIYKIRRKSLVQNFPLWNKARDVSVLQVLTILCRIFVSSQDFVVQIHIIKYVIIHAEPQCTMWLHHLIIIIMQTHLKALN